MAQKFLDQFKKPRQDLLDLSLKIINGFLKKYGSESDYLRSEGELLTIE
jgi:hypothetical protein